MALDVTQTEFEQLEAYLHGDLSAAERAALDADPRLAEALVALLTAQQAVRHFALRQAVRAVSAQIAEEGEQTTAPSEAAPSPAPPQPLPLKKDGRGWPDAPLTVSLPEVARPWWTTARRLAAGLVAVLAVGLGLRLATLSAPGLADAATLPYQVATTRGVETNRVDFSQQLKADYQRADYAACAQRYESQPATDRQPLDHLLAGNAYLALQQYGPAQASFRRVLAANAGQPEQPYQEDAEYYLALALLRDNRVSEAAPIFNRIYRNPNHPYHAQVGWAFYQQLRWLNR